MLVLCDLNIDAVAHFGPPFMAHIFPNIHIQSVSFVSIHVHLSVRYLYSMSAHVCIGYAHMHIHAETHTLKVF